MSAPAEELAGTRYSRLALATLFATILAGCSSLNPGEVATATASAGAEPPRVSLTGPPDAELEQRLAGIFGQIDGLSSVQVEVRHGVAHLMGTTETASNEARAATTASRLDGIVYVKDDIVQPPSAWGPLGSVGRALRRLGRIALDAVPRAIAAIIVVTPFVLASSALGRWGRPFQALGLGPLSGNLVRLTLRATALVAGLLIALDVLGLLATAGAVVGALGVIGIVIGLVFKDWVSIYLPGLMLGLRPPFKTGDTIRIGAHEGRVARLTPSATVLVTADAEEVRVPNAEFFKSVLVNFSRHRTRRLRISVALALQADLRKTEELGCDAILDLRGIHAEPPPFMRVNRQNEERVDVEFFAWVNQDETNFRNVESCAVRAVLEALLESDIPMPAMTLTLRRPREESTRPEVADDANQEKSVALDRAESLDREFVDQEFDRSRAATNERDLLREAHGKSYR